MKHSRQITELHTEFGTLKAACEKKSGWGYVVDRILKVAALGPVLFLILKALLPKYAKTLDDLVASNNFILGSSLIALSVIVYMWISVLQKNYDDMMNLAQKSLNVLDDLNDHHEELAKQNERLVEKAYLYDQWNATLHLLSHAPQIAVSKEDALNTNAKRVENSQNR